MHRNIDAVLRMVAFKKGNGAPLDRAISRDVGVDLVGYPDKKWFCELGFGVENMTVQEITDMAVDDVGDSV